MRKLSLGFSAIEVMVALIFLSLLMLTYVRNKVDALHLQRVNQMITQTQMYEKFFINYVSLSSREINQQVNSNHPVIISMYDLVQSGSDPMGVSSTNILGQNPCLSLIKNAKTNQIEAIMYFVGSGNSPLMSTLDIKKVVTGLGGVAAYYDGNSASNSSWSVDKQSVFLQNTDQCRKGYNLNANTIMVNFSLLPEFNQVLQPDVSLHREHDSGGNNNSSNEYGNFHNRNTLLSDMHVGHGVKILMNNANKLSLTDQASNNSIVLESGDLMASTLQATKKIKSGTACKVSELGEVAMQDETSDGTPTSFTQSNVVCGYNPALCQIRSGSDYCYLPILVNRITFNNQQPTNWMGNRFLCPGYAPFAEDAKGGGSVTLDIYMDEYYSGALQHQGLFCEGSSDKAVRCDYWHTTPLYVDEHPSTHINADIDAQFVVGQAPNGYHVNIGYEVSPTPADCNKLCNAVPLQYGRNDGCTYLPANPEIFTDSRSGRQYCWCKINGISILCPGDVSLFAAIEQTSTKANLNWVRCTTTPIFSNE